MQGEASIDTQTSERRRIGTLEAELAELKDSHRQLRRAYMHALEQLQLMRRRMFLAKAERREEVAEQLVFEGMFAEVERLEKELEELRNAEDAAGVKGEGGNEGSGVEAGSGGDDPKGDKPKKGGGKGRRNLENSDLPIVVLEVSDPELEGKAERIGVEKSWKLAYEPGGMRRLLISRIVYKTADFVPPDSHCEQAADELRPDGGSAAVETGRGIVTTSLPKELFRRSLLAPSMVAHLLFAKYVLGVPFYRLEQQFELRGTGLDRGTMCRYAEDAGGALGAIVEAMRKDAFETAFCLSTDATGVRIQPCRLVEGKGRPRGPCDI